MKYLSGILGHVSLRVAIILFIYFEVKGYTVKLLNLIFHLLYATLLYVKFTYDNNEYHPKIIITIGWQSFKIESFGRLELLSYL